MRIFIDVGAHEGQTIETVLAPEFKIDLVYAFEPSPTCYGILLKNFSGNSKVIILNFGLWKETQELLLHNESTQGASIYSDYQTTWKGHGKETLCSFVKASEWFRNNLGGGEIFLKLNCEGCECEIINDLIDSGEFNKLKAVLVDYDVRKSSSLRCQEAELKKRIACLNIDNVFMYMDPYRARVLKEVLG